jgi:heme-degrading monooxygenase HmoA
MARPRVVFLAKFNSPLTLEEVESVAASRIEQFRALPGLQQKYHLQDAASDEYAGLYLWESEEALIEFRDSELRATIAEAYQTQGEPRIEVFNIFEILRD